MEKTYLIVRVIAIIIIRNYFRAKIRNDFDISIFLLTSFTEIGRKVCGNERFSFTLQMDNAMKSTKIIIWVSVLLSILGLCNSVQAERGVASFYHDKFHGRPMANGEKYHRDSFTCAHRRYPLGTWLRVSNPKNNKAVIVQVTDRGPFSKRFTIDLSRAAARHLDIIAAGVAPVEINQVSSRQGGIVPFRLENEEKEIVDIELDFVPAAQYSFPDWHKDTTPPTDRRP